MSEKGVIVGADQNLEWMLPWWWENYIQENDLPVAFADFGLTVSARKWCEERGSIIEINEHKVTPKEELDAEISQKWEKDFNSFIWKKRTSWFKKPSALMKSPFDLGIWLDIDCEVLGSLNPLFQHIDPISGMGLVREPEHFQQRSTDSGRYLPGEIIYNAGVIVFHRHSLLLKNWAFHSLLQNHRFAGDQDVLTHLILTESQTVGEIPNLYNWLILQGININAQIIHWVGESKEIIKSQGGFRKMQKEMFNG